MVRVGAAHIEGAECIAILQSQIITDSTAFTLKSFISCWRTTDAFMPRQPDSMLEITTSVFVVSPASPEDTFQSKYL